MSLLNRYEQRLQQEAQPKSLLQRVEERLNQRTIRKDVLETYERLHREHQRWSLEAASNNDKGQIILPTGTGKTRVQIHLHVAHMLQASERNEAGVYVIAAHRLLLCKQLMDELQDLCIKCGLPINTLYVGSARQDDRKVYERYFSEGITSDNFQSSYTTKKDDIKSFYKATRDSNRHLIVVSTYHSFDKLSVIDDIDQCTYDEAHTTVSDDFTKNISEVYPNIRKSYFFTATRKVMGEDGGMNDVDRYGSVIISISPREMIEAGEILMPTLHLMKLENSKKKSIKSDDEAMLVRTITEGFEEHRKRLKAESADPESIGAKLLVSAKGSDEIRILQNSQTFKDWCRDNNVRVFSFSCEYGSFEDFKEIPNRNDVYESMRNLRDEEDCIIIHIDILTEGIDLPAITAAMLLRHLNVIRLMQTMGRALRLLKRDRVRFYAGEISPQDKSKYVKPNAYLLLPMHMEGMEESTEEMRKTIRRMVSEYGIPSEEFLPMEEFEGKIQEMLDNVTTPWEKREIMEKYYPLLHIFEEIVMEQFQESLPQDPQERYDTLTNMLISLQEERS